MRKKALALSLIVVVAIVALIGVYVQGLSIDEQPSSPKTLEERALACLEQVYPLELRHYNVSLGSNYTLPSSGESDNSTTRAVDYMLASSDSNLIANFLFKDDLLYSLSLSVINGSVAKVQYANLMEAARDFLVKYQAFSGINSSELILALNKFDAAQEIPATVGDVRFWISHFAIPNVANSTTFRWLYADNASVTLDFYGDFHGNRDVFGAFYDYRQFGHDTVAVAPSSSVATNQENSSLQTSAKPSSASSSGSSSTETAQTPEPTFAPDSAYPEGTKDWLPWGSFGMLSPANQTYTTNNLILNVTGGVISGDAYSPILSYSLDGGQRVLVPITLTKPEGLGLTFQRVISGSIALPPLSNGSHVIVLYGDLGFESRRGKVTVYFAVEA